MARGRTPGHRRDRDAELGPVTKQPGNAGSLELVELYRTSYGGHEDRDEYRPAMI